MYKQYNTVVEECDDEEASFDYGQEKQPSHPSEHYQPSHPSEHYQPSHPSEHYQPSHPAEHYQPSHPAEHFQSSHHLTEHCPNSRVSLKSSSKHGAN